MISKRAVRLMFAALLTHLATPAPAQTTGAGNTETSVADGKRNPNLGGPALTGERRPLYRLRKSDVVEIRFTFTPEFDQSVTVQPDGFVALKAVGSIFAEGLTLTELHDAVGKVYQTALREPEVSIILKDFEKPYFIAGGQVGHPGKYELRAPTTAAEAVAIAGGFNDASKHSQVLLFHAEERRGFSRTRTRLDTAEIERSRICRSRSARFDCGDNRTDTRPWCKAARFA